MKNNVSKITLREAWSLNSRALGIWRRYNTRLIFVTTINTMVSVLTPYVGLYLSALIINELAGVRDPARLTRLVIAALLSSALLALLGAVLARWRNCENSDLWYGINKIYTDKLMSMDFKSVDAQSTHDRSQKPPQYCRLRKYAVRAAHRDGETSLFPPARGA